MSQFGWILHDLPVGVWVGRVPTGEAEYVNRAFSEIMGIGAVEGADIEAAPGAYGIFTRKGELYPVEMLPFSRVVATGLSVVVDDLVIRRPDGRSVNVRALGNPVRDDAGALTHVIVAFIDITKEVTAERDRDSMETRLALAVDHAPIVIWTADCNGVVGLSTGAGLKALGVESGQLVGSSIFDLYGDHPTIPDFLRRAIAGESLSYTVQVGEVVFDTYVTPLRDERGQMTGVAAVSNDVSEIRQLQARAIQNDRVVAMGTLAASVAHEINNPLVYVMSHLEAVSTNVDNLKVNLLAGEIDTEHFTQILNASQGSLQIARQGTQRMSTITQELRTFSHPADENHTQVEVQDAIESVLRLIGKEVEAGTRLVLKLQKAPPVLASEAKLVQVILNLVMNAKQAVEASPADSREICIATWSAENQVIIEVSDSGPGIEQADRERIFEPFVTTKNIGEGSGLGLFVCKNIVNSLGGKIEVSESKSGGALLRISLPQAVAVAPTLKENAADTLSARGASIGNILIIDDDPLVAEVFEQMLLHSGFHVQCATNGEEALVLLTTDTTIDLAFCDLMMAGMTGMTIARELEERAPLQLKKMVYMTGGAFTSEARQLLARYPEQSVHKPFDIVKEARRRLANKL